VVVVFRLVNPPGSDQRVDEFLRFPRPVAGGCYPFDVVATDVASGSVLISEGKQQIYRPDRFAKTRSGEFLEVLHFRMVDRIVFRIRSFFQTRTVGGGIIDADSLGRGFCHLRQSATWMYLSGPTE
jgi:hypothetical protein